MIARFLVLVITLTASVSLAQDNFLRINPAGHQGQIRDMVITKDGKYAVTASFDKSIKKWNLETGEIEQEFRSEIGLGAEGMVYYIALSPDEKYLASTGWFGADDETEVLGDIRVFDFKTGKMAYVLKGLGNTPAGLGFSADSKYLVAGDVDSKVLKWELSSQKQVADYSYHSSELGEELERLVVAGNTMITAGFDGKLCLWDLTKSSGPTKEDKKFFKEALLDNIGDVAISPDGKEIAVSLNHFIIIYNKALKPYFVIENKEKPGFLRFSGDGTRLLTGSVKSGSDPHHCYVFEKNGNEWTEFTSYDAHTNSVIAGGFVDRKTCITGGGANDEICVWETQSKGVAPVLKKRMQGIGQAFYASSLTDEKVAFATQWTANQGMSKLVQTFDLFQKHFGVVTDENRYNKPKQKYNTMSLSTYNEGGYAIVNPKLIIEIGGRGTDTIERDPWNGSRHNVYGWTPSGMVISGGSQGIMSAYDFRGVETNYFVGHEGDIWGASISADRRRLITCGSDQTIRIWPLDKLGIENPNPPMKSMWDYLIEMDADDPYHKILKMYKADGFAQQKTYEGWEKALEILKKNDYPIEFLQRKLQTYKATTIYPLVSMFIAKNGEWIIWNEDGYFSASKKGAQYVGYHVNKGKNKEARFYPFGQFDLKYNRPDIILQDLSMGDEKSIEFYRMAYLKRLKKLGLTEEQLSGDIHLPEVEIVNYEVSGDQITLKIKGLDSKYDLNRLNVFINDVPIFGSNGKKIANSKTTEQELNFPLAAGKNKVEVSVLNDKGAESLRENIWIHQEGNKQPNLYILSIGTSHYKDKRFDLQYASKDAQDVEKAFEEDEVYGEVFHQVLLDENATKTNILAAKDFLKKAGRNDVVVVFLAGHGVLDANLDYYYAAHDIDFNDPKNGGVIYSDIEDLLDGITALKKLLFMDTCHSGEVDKEEVAMVNEEVVQEGDITFRAAGIGVRLKNGEGLRATAEMVKELFSDVRRGTGATVISSAGGAEFAMESDKWKNGLFTFCLLDAISGNAADLNGDNQVMLSELQAYLQETVKQKSGGKQVPTSRIENLALDYRIR